MFDDPAMVRKEKLHSHAMGGRGSNRFVSTEADIKDDTEKQDENSEVFQRSSADPAAGLHSASSGLVWTMPYYLIITLLQPSLNGRLMNLYKCATSSVILPSALRLKERSLTLCVLIRGEIPT